MALYGPAKRWNLDREVRRDLVKGLSTCHKHPRVSVILCTLGTRLELTRTVESLVTQDCEQFEILIVQNGKINKSLAHTMLPYPVQVLNEPRLGVSIARNFAVRHASGEILVFVDDDIIAHPGWLHELVIGFEDPAVACVTGRILPQGTSYFGPMADEILRTSPLALSPRCFDSSHPNWFRELLTKHFGSGCNMAFRKSFLIKSAFLPEDLGAGSLIGSNDDTYMFLQVVKHGFRLQYIPTAVVTHVYDTDARSRKLRVRQLHSSAVGFGIKLLLEEKGLRWSVAKWMIAGLIKRTLELFRLRGSVPDSETISSKDKFLANLRGILIYWKAHGSRRCENVKNCPAVKE